MTSLKLVSNDTSNDYSYFKLAKGFMKKHPWYRGPRSKHRDTVKLTQIDNHLTAEGHLSPRDPAYWAELERRAAVAMPHRFNK